MNDDVLVLADGKFRYQNDLKTSQALVFSH